MSQRPRPQKLHEVQDEYNDKIVGLCLACNKQVKGGYYANYSEGGVCNKTCMQVQDKKPKYPEHTEEAFLTKFNLE
jgi:hypothetical protein